MSDPAPVFRARHVLAIERRLVIPARLAAAVIVTVAWLLPPDWLSLPGTWFAPGPLRWLFTVWLVSAWAAPLLWRLRHRPVYRVVSRVCLMLDVAAVLVGMVATGGHRSPLLLLMPVFLMRALLTEHLRQLGRFALAVTVAVVWGLAIAADGLTALTDWYLWLLTFGTWQGVAWVGSFNQDVRARVEELLVLAGTDELTGLANRRAFLQAVEREIARSDRTRQPFTILIADLDELKKVNDTRGHLAGDEAIRAVAECMRETLRCQDLIARLGGDEFGALLPQTERYGATQLAERVQSNLWEKGRLRLSIGVCEREPGMSADALHRFADLDMYRNKEKRSLLARQG